MRINTELEFEFDNFTESKVSHVIHQYENVKSPAKESYQDSVNLLANVRSQNFQY